VTSAVLTLESVVSSRLLLAERIKACLETDHRVRRWRRIEFGDLGSGLTATIVAEARQHGTCLRSELADDLEARILYRLPELATVSVQLY
jgi:hypothetical protein